MSGERTSLLNSERLKYRQIKVEEVGVDKEVRDEVHAKANHYIEESRPYFPNAQLPKYIDCPYFLKIARLVFFASLICTLVFRISGSVSKAIPIGFFGACLLFFFIYCQHERVNQMSLPLVLKQPVFDSQRSLNEFYEVTVTELDGIALQNYQAGFGFIHLTHGKIKIQAFNRKAIKQMSDAKCQSRLMLFLFLVSVIIYGFFILPYFLKRYYLRIII
ncbi:hypothetical protein ABFA07_012491 [Porites harrisoni]